MKNITNSNEPFNYLNTIKKINIMNGTPRQLSKEDIFSQKNKNSNRKQKDPIFNESIPIKVRLIKAARLNPNINFTQIKNLNKTKKEEKDEKEDNNINQSELKQPKIISQFNFFLLLTIFIIN